LGLAPQDAKANFIPPLWHLKWQVDWTWCLELTKELGGVAAAADLHLYELSRKKK